MFAWVLNVNPVERGKGDVWIRLGLVGKIINYFIQIELELDLISFEPKFSNILCEDSLNIVSPKIFLSLFKKQRPTSYALLANISR